MRELNFSFHVPQIKINGLVFDLKKSDIEICEIAKNAQERLRGLNTEDVDEIISACKATAFDIDSILGDGALAKIAGGKPIGIIKQIEILVAIASEGTREYIDYVKNEYLQDE